MEIVGPVWCPVKAHNNGHNLSAGTDNLSLQFISQSTVWDRPLILGDFPQIVPCCRCSMMESPFGESEFRAIDLQ